ncbi:PAQR3 isoform 8 [Pan troglodytes]|uniref:PAQR3 isoform 1 n=2 Tax=Hominidae TaxID=9604 RepID=A0A2J8UUG1_PONAB|nr:PAQR3 isoform 1 [Pan troglodytes]PNI82946.1 PAQR3 isoform 8 [Pan troglodytes]PNJ48900.1 PAQR3 isoform 1 [Pongo abelii]PNJ48905.1 PAQR3 isoform 8 [Pongo abelii]
MHQKLLKSAHYIELGSYQYWPVLVPRGIRLYTYEQIPVSLKDNPYITDGYRAYLPSRLCIKRSVCFALWAIIFFPAIGQKKHVEDGWH